MSPANVVEVNVYDGSKIHSVLAKLSSIKGINKIKDNYVKEISSTFEIELNNDGKDGDVAKGDFIFSKKIESKGFYLYEIEVTATDDFGNKTIFKAPNYFLVF